MDHENFGCIVLRSGDPPVLRLEIDGQVRNVRLETAPLDAPTIEELIDDIPMDVESRHAPRVSGSLRTFAYDYVIERHEGLLQMTLTRQHRFRKVSE